MDFDLLNSGFIGYLSLAVKFLSQYKSAIFFLFPLGILLPSWWIFLIKLLLLLGL